MMSCHGLFQGNFDANEGLDFVCKDKMAHFKYALEYTFEVILKYEELVCSVAE